MTTIVGWVQFGLVAGATARVIHPGFDPMGNAGTILLGITGSLLGYGTSLTQGAGWILSIIGAIVPLSVGAVVGGRARRTV